MIRRTQALEAFERWYAKERWKDSTFDEALAVFEALWVEASTFHGDFQRDWREDIAVDLTLARILNGLPATS